MTSVRAARAGRTAPAGSAAWAGDVIAGECYPPIGRPVSRGPVAQAHGRGALVHDVDAAGGDDVPSRARLQRAHLVGELAAQDARVLPSGVLQPPRGDVLGDGVEVRGDPRRVVAAVRPVAAELLERDAAEQQGVRGSRCSRSASSTSDPSTPASSAAGRNQPRSRRSRRRASCSGRRSGPSIRSSADRHNVSGGVMAAAPTAAAGGAPRARRRSRRARRRPRRRRAAAPRRPRPRPRRAARCG